MRVSSALLACSALGFGLAMAEGEQFVSAPETNNNPEGVVYRADLLEKDSTDIRGSVTATAGPDGKGVVFKVDMYGFPDENEFGPFPYHIHVAPVPDDGNCTKTLAHLDPFARGEKPPCDPSAPATCQVGDLSGKYGHIKDVADGKHFQQTYHDLWTTTLEGPGAFFGNRSIVVHYKNVTRVNCGNFKLVSGNGTTPPYPTGGPGVPPAPTGTPGMPVPPPGEGAASRVGAVSVGVILAGIAALML